MTRGEVKIFDGKTKIKTTETNRDRIIYMMAIDRSPNLNQLDPPPTEEEEKDYAELCKRMRKTEAEWPKDAPPLIWDMPFDFD